MLSFILHVVVPNNRLNDTVKQRQQNIKNPKTRTKGVCRSGYMNEKFAIKSSQVFMGEVHWCLWGQTMSK